MGIKETMPCSMCGEEFGPKQHYKGVDWDFICKRCGKEIEESLEEINNP